MAGKIFKIILNLIGWALIALLFYFTYQETGWATTTLLALIYGQFWIALGIDKINSREE